MLSVHLARVCMKNSTQAEELQKAKASNRGWVLTGRTWDYNKLCEILPDPSCRLNMVKELLRRGFFIKNQSEESELVLGHAEATTTATLSSTKDWQNVLRAGKAAFLRIFKNLQTGVVVSGSEKVLYRYYCEAILLYRHHQSPGTVKGFTVSYSV